MRKPMKISDTVEPPLMPQGQRPSLLKISAILFICFVLFATWLIFDLQRGYEKVLADTSYRAMQRSQIIGQSFRTEVLAADYVLRDVLGRFQESDLVFPDPDPNHAQRMTKLLKEKADTVPDFFSMVLFDHDCVFAVTATGQNTGVRSKPELCVARKRHQGPGPLVSYVPGSVAVSGRSVLVLSRHLTSPSGVFRGGVMGVIELERAQHRFDSLSLEPGDSVALLDESQVLLARRPQLAQALEKRVVTPEIPAALRTITSVAPVALQRDVDGRERLFGFSKVEGFPLVVAYGFDKALAIEAWQRRAMELGLGYLTLLVLAVLAARTHWTMLLQRDELIASRSALQTLVSHDALTGLYNRRFLDAALPRELARSERDNKQMAIIMLDVDHFKKVNDRYGHVAGDEVLKALAELLRKSARESDLICRYGGEEFVAVMPDMGTDQALVRAESWRKQLEEMTIACADVEIHITLSAGIAVFPKHGSDPSHLITRADDMLYRAKREGRNRVCVDTVQ